MLWVKLVIILFSEANCCLRCRFPRLYRPSCRVKGDELNYWSGTSFPTFTCSLAHAKWTCSALCRDHDQASTSQCCWNFDMAFSSPGCDEQNSRSNDQLKGTIISFQSLQTSFRSFPNTQESILCYSMYVLQLTNLYTLYDTLIPYAYVLAGTVSCSASTYSQFSKFQRNFAKFADFGPSEI